MASGKTLELIKFTRDRSWRKLSDREKRPRDRSLNGKARKIENKK